MAVLHNPLLAGASGNQGSYEIEQSLRFDSGDSTYLNWTPGSAGDRTLWTWSAWIKRSGFSSTVGLFGSYAASNNTDYLEILFASANTLLVQGNSIAFLNTSQVFRDPSAWYHIVIAVDTSNATANDRIKIYVNGEQVTDFGTRNNPSSGGNLGVNQAGVHRLGRRPNGTDYFNGYMAEVNFIDGAALDHEDFGELDDSGVWRPIKYAGSYTGNSFYLKFASGDGTDSSGLSNTWTANGFTVNPDPYVLATKTSGTFSTGELRDVFDSSSGSSGGVYQEATTGSTAASTIDIEFSSALSGTITVEASDGTGGTNTGGQYQLIDSTDTVQVTQARPTTTTTFTHTGLSDITKLRMYGGSSGLGGILISRFESSGQTIRTADWLGEGDVMSDTPTTNWCTLNPLTTGSYMTLSNGNLDALGNTSADNGNSRTTFVVTSGKFYFETTLTANRSTVYPQIGIMRERDGNRPNNAAPQAGYSSSMIYGSQSIIYQADGTKYSNSSSSSYGNSFTSGDTIGVAYDGDNGAIYFSKNGTWQNSGDPTSGASKTGAALTWTDDRDYVFSIANYNSTATSCNFGQRDFVYTPPTGFKALNTSNLSEPDIADGSKYFDTLTYIGDGLTPKEINGLEFQPDFVWIKDKSASTDHILTDAVRGATINMVANNTTIDNTNAQNLQSFDPDGFTVGNASQINLSSGRSYVAWNWLGANGTQTLTTGSIDSTVSANPTAGFSIVGYEGTFAAETIAHGLGNAPSLIITKSRDTADRWQVYHSAVGNGYTMRLETITAAGADSGAWNSTSPTSTVFSVGASVRTNRSGDNFIAYCFAEVEGYSKFGAYNTNVSSDGPFVYLGFAPRFLLIKSTTGRSWLMMDTERSPYNPAVIAIRPGDGSAGDETNNWDIDFLSNGFKVRSTNANTNTDSSGVYTYSAFASNPFGGSGVSPATAR